jgi:hypothetical protein
VELFESKVDSILAFARWLFAVSPGALVRLDRVYEGWSRALLGADFWRNADVCRGELGWSLTGSARGACSVALRHARVLALPPGDLYKDAFLAAESVGTGWAVASLAVLRNCGISDWRVLGDNLSYDGYARHVSSKAVEACTPPWQAGILRHSSQVPYSLLQSAPSDILSRIRGAGLTWSTQVGIYGWSRLRAGLTSLRCIGGKYTRARFAQCIFCAQTVRNGHVHTLACCQRWTSLREAFVALAPAGVDSLAGGLCKAILTAVPESRPSFAAAVELCDAVDRAASVFWSRAGR